MTFQQELSSWAFPKSVTISPVPEVGSKAPSTSELSFPTSDGKPSVIAFLRHCGCPFAEKTFLGLRDLPSKDTSKNYVAVSHPSDSTTKNWLRSVGGEGNVRVIVDENESYMENGAWSGSRWQTSGSFAVCKNGTVKWVAVSKAADEVPVFGEATKALSGA
ncbi:hypothetical protein DL95DRAFT_518427 [Leptodontidium sp. 2 PMI_412]|nr:hypothetical protein BKA61DRAFT_730380 [Leptodontidium sp. MPI-SDFR-AT-0119]KAH9222914.1 hypothetical protein DL95DRAFT_518427 [Leptodontidium sp. 2 PMI_412]